MAKTKGGAGRKSILVREGSQNTVLLSKPTRDQRAALSSEIDEIQRNVGFGATLTMARRAILGSNEVLIVRNPSGELAGVAGFGERTTIGPSMLYIDYLSGLQTGYGRQALVGVAREAVKRGLGGIELESTFNAKRFYESLGMKQRGVYFYMTSYDIQGKWLRNG